MENTHKTLARLARAGLWIVLAGYAFVLVKIILLKYGLGAGLRSFNFVPLRFVCELRAPSTSLDVVLKNVLGNFAIFIPLGMLAPALFSRVNVWWKSVLLGFCVSALFELLQCVFGLGATDVDDLLLNTLGAAAGGGLYFGALACLRAEWKTRLAAFAFLCAFGLLGVLALWLYAPSELPRQVERVNIEVLDGLELASAAASVTVDAFDAEGFHCRAPESEVAEASAVRTDYPLREDAKLYLQSISAQYSPNGNVQKTICSYSAAEPSDITRLLEANGYVFADLWLDEAGACTIAVLTEYLN